MVAGSSPRMRGTQHPAHDREDIAGIIPAYAGNTARCAQARISPWDHPRVCGEHTVINGVALPDAGSSPRMRGTRKCNHTALVEAGIIPAYAGNTKPIR